MKLVGVLQIFIKVGDMKVKLCFGVIDGLAVAVILERSFIDRFIRAIFPSKRKIVPFNSQEIAILTTLRYQSSLSTIKM